MPQFALDGSSFYASVELQLTSEWPNAAGDVFLEQVGQPGASPSLPFKVWMRLYAAAGAGHYTAIGDAWTHEGSLHPVRPTAQVRAALVVSSPTGPTGATGPEGPPGAASTVTGPTGPRGLTGAASTVAGPTGTSGPPGSVVYALPNVTNNWIRLGTVTGLAAGTAVVVQVFSNDLLAGDVKDELYCTVRFSTSNGTSYVRQGANGQPFYGEASIVQSLNFDRTAAFAIQQNSATSYSFFFNTGATPGTGFFTVKSQAAFTYSGTTTAPTGCFLSPNLLFEQGIFNGEAIFTADTVLANTYGARFEGPVAILDSTGAELLSLGPAGSEFYTPLAVPSLTATGQVSIPNGALSIANTNGLQAALDTKNHVNIRYPLFPNPTGQPEWFELGTFTAQADNRRTMQLDMCQQDEATGLFKQATLFFGTTDIFGTQSYDTPSISLNAWAELRTASPDWWDGTLSEDFAVKRNSDTSYTLFYRSYNINWITGFFTVQHAPGDSWTYAGYYRGSTRPTNAFHPVASSSVSASMIDPDFTGQTVQCLDLAAASAVTCANLNCANVNSSTTANLKNLSCTGASFSGAVSFSGTVSLPMFQEIRNGSLTGTATATSIFGDFLMAQTRGFSSIFGANTMVANQGQTIYQVTGAQRGLIFTDTDPTLVATAQSTVAYFTTMSGVNSLSVLARNGNALGSNNLGTTASGTYTMTLTINSSGAVRASIQQNGNLRWNVLLFSATSV